jgi:hypothetical protein
MSDEEEPPVAGWNPRLAATPPPTAAAPPTATPPPTAPPPPVPVLNAGESLMPNG